MTNGVEYGSKGKTCVSIKGENDGHTYSTLH
jgi:hypothetical protein